MSRVSGTQYSITSSTRRCAATDRELATGERFVAALVQHPDADVFERLDFSETAWNDGARPQRPLILFGFWRGVMPDPTAKKRFLVDDQSLLELFEQSASPMDGDQSASDNDRLAFRFVLALILLRKRLLTQEGSKGSTMLVRPRGVPKPPEGPPLIRVEDPRLDEAALLRVTDRLGAVISGDMTTSPASAQPAPASPGDAA